MSHYPPKVNDRFTSPRYSGPTARATATGAGASFVCGCFVRVFLEIEAQTRLIMNAAFRSNGCGFMVSAADLAAESLAGKELTSLHSMEGHAFFEAIEAGLGLWPAERRHCVDAVLDAIRAALADHRSKTLEEFHGEKALICTCFGISEESLDRYITEHSPSSADVVAAELRAGSGCGSCRMLVQEMIDERSRVWPDD